MVGILCFFVKLNLLVTWTLYRDANLQITSDGTEILRFRVEKSDPLILNGVLGGGVHLGHVELVHANKLVLQPTLVFDPDADSIELDLTRMDVARLEKHVLTPGDGCFRATRHVSL